MTINVPLSLGGGQAPSTCELQGVSTAAPRMRPARSSASASLAWPRGKTVTSVRIGHTLDEREQLLAVAARQVRDRAHASARPRAGRRGSWGCRSCGCRRRPRRRPCRRGAGPRGRARPPARRRWRHRAARAAPRRSCPPTRRPARARARAPPHFFETYKNLEGKNVMVFGWKGLEPAIYILEEAKSRYAEIDK